MAIAIEPNIENKFIDLTEGEKTYRLQYAQTEGFLGFGRDNENGFVICDHHGSPLGGTALKEAEAVILRAALQKDSPLNHAMTSIFRERFFATDNDLSSKDRVNEGDINNVHEGITVSSFVETPAVNPTPSPYQAPHIPDIENAPTTLMQALSLKPFIEAVQSIKQEGLLEDGQLWDYVNEEFKPNDAKASVEIFRAAGLEDIQIIQLLPLTAKEQALADKVLTLDTGTKAPDTEPETETSTETKKKKEADVTEPDNVLPSFADVTALQQTFGFENPHGVYDHTTQQTVKNYFHTLLEGLVVDGKPTAPEILNRGDNPVINLHTNDGKNHLFEFAEERHPDTGEPSYMIYEVKNNEDGELERVKKKDGTYGDRLDVARLHPALVALTRQVYINKSDRLNAAENEALIRQNQVILKEDLLEEQEAESRKLLKELGLNESAYLTDLLNDLEGSEYDEDTFKKSKAHKALMDKIAQKPKDEQKGATESLENFLIIMQGIASTYTGTQPDSDAVMFAHEDFNRISSINNMFHFMTEKGTPYNVNDYDNVMANTVLQDNILSVNIYKRLQNAGMQDVFGVHSLYDTSNTGQKNRILEYFGDQTTATKAEILEYHTMRFQISAIRALTAGEEKPPAKKEKQSTEEYRQILNNFIEENKSVLRGVTAAMEGNYTLRDGKGNPTGEKRWFLPFERDVALASQAPGTPSLLDQPYGSMIDRIADKTNKYAGGYSHLKSHEQIRKDDHPTGIDAIKKLRSTADQEALFLSGIDHINRTELLYASDEVSVSRGYNKTSNMSHNVHPMDVGAKYLAEGTPVRRREYVTLLFNKLQGMDEAQRLQTFREMSKQDQETFIGAIVQRRRPAMLAEQTDALRTLGLQSGANKAEIKNAYKKLVEDLDLKAAGTEAQVESFTQAKNALLGQHSYDRVLSSHYQNRFRGYISAQQSPYFNETYGVSNEDIKTRFYIRCNSLQLAREYGEEAAKIFFTDKDMVYQDHNATYDEVLKHLESVSPAKAAKFKQHIESMDAVDGYKWFVRLNLDRYREKRKNHYIPQAKAQIIMEKERRNGKEGITPKGQSADEIAKAKAKAQAEADAQARSANKGDTKNENETAEKKKEHDFSLHTKPLEEDPIMVSAIKGQAPETSLKLKDRFDTFRAAPIKQGTEELASLIDKLGASKATEIMNSLTIALEESKNANADKVSRDLAKGLYQTALEKHGLTKNALRAYAANGINISTSDIHAAANPASASKTATAANGAEEIKHLRDKLGASKATEIMESLTAALEESKSGNADKVTRDLARGLYETVLEKHGLTQNAVDTYNANASKPATDVTITDAKGRAINPDSPLIATPDSPQFLDSKGEKIQSVETAHLVDKNGQPIKSTEAPKLVGTNGKPLSADDAIKILDTTGSTVHNTPSIRIPEFGTEYTVTPDKQVQIKQLKVLDDIPLLDKIPEIKAPSKFSRAWDAISTPFKALGKLSAKASKYPLAAIGAGIAATAASAEYLHCMKDKNFLKATGLLQEEADLMVNSIHAYNITQSAGDPSIFLGESVTEFMIDKAIEEHNIDAVTANMVMPDTLIGMLKNDGLSAEQYARLEQTFGDKKLNEMYINIAKEYGLPETMTVEIKGKEQQISIGEYLRDPELAEQYIESLKTGRETVEEWKTNPHNGSPYLALNSVDIYDPSKQGVDYIIALNDMASQARHLLDTNNALTINVGDETYRMNYHFNEKLFGKEHNEKNFVLEVKTAYGYLEANHAASETMAQRRMGFKDLQSKFNGEFQQAVISHETETLNHMKAVMTKRIIGTDGDKQDMATAKDVNKLLERFRGENNLISAMATKSIYMAIEELGSDKISDREKRKVMLNRLDDTRNADAIIAKAHNGGATHKAEHDTATLRSPFNIATNDATKNQPDPAASPKVTDASEGMRPTTPEDIQRAETPATPGSNNLAS